jgi:anti-sigma regulatory factor (Ser/Thr protein kinase)
VAILRKKFKRHLNSLAEVFDFIDRFVDQEEIDDSARRAISLAVDELFTNMVKYDTKNPNDITIELQVDDQNLLVTLIDRDVARFDITKKPDPYLGASLDDRKPGGLGIFLTKKLVDDVQYHYQDRTSTITLKKKIRKKNV